jgi:hypothetical protein
LRKKVLTMPSVKMTQMTTDAYLWLEVEGPDHAQGEYNTDDSKQGDGGDEKGVTLIISSSVLRH